MGAQGAPIFMIIVFLPFVVSFSVYAIYHEIMEHPRALSALKSILAGFSCLLFVILSCFGFDFFRRRVPGVSMSYSFHNLMKHYFCLMKLQFIGRRMKNKLESDTLNITQTQEKILINQIHRNQNTEYGKKFKFKFLKLVDDFINMHPLTRYSHYQHFIERIIEGNESVLNFDDPILLAITSGASGHSNIVPIDNRDLNNHFKFGYSIVWRILIEHFPELKKIRKILRFVYTPARNETDGCGIEFGRKSSNIVENINMLTTPAVAFQINDEFCQLYIHLLFGLRDGNIGLIESSVASVLYNAMKALRNHWIDLVNDIESGTINLDLKLSPNIRKSLQNCLKPDIKRANYLRKEFQKGFDGLVSRLWPDLQCVLTVDSGSNDIYGRILKQHEYQGIIFYSPLYSATEGLFGINIDPLSHNRYYLLIPNTIFYEFIPLEISEEEEPKTVLMENVEENHDYELVISNQSGFYRYRFGDVLRIVGFHNQCPLIEFLYRQNQFLNVRGEKTSEKAFYSALMKTVRNWHGIRIVDYCCVESAVLEETNLDKSTIQGSGDAPYYCVFLEMENGHLLCETQLDEIDKNLCEEFFVYESYRKKNSIAPMLVRLVKPGTFTDLRKYFTKNSELALNLYKIPRVLRRRDAVEFMLNNTISDDFF